MQRGKHIAIVEDDDSIRALIAENLKNAGYRVSAFFTAEQGRSLIAYGRESARELRKVVWPSRKEALQMTGYVFAFVVVMALFLWLTDKTLEWVLYDLVLGWKR